MFNTLPDSQIRNLVGHLSQCLCGPQYVFPLFSSTQLSHLAGFVQNHTQGNFTRVPWGAETRQDHIVEEKKKVESDVFSRVWQKIQLPGCPWGSFNQLLPWPIFDSIKARDLFKASIS